MERTHEGALGQCEFDMSTELRISVADVKSSPIFAGHVVGVLDVVAVARSAIAQRCRARGGECFKLGRCERTLTKDATLCDDRALGDRMGLTFVERSSTAREDGASFTS
jgi:hypothetical protein